MADRVSRSINGPKTRLNDSSVSQSKLCNLFIFLIFSTFHSVILPSNSLMVLMVVQVPCLAKDNYRYIIILVQFGYAYTHFIKMSLQTSDVIVKYSKMYAFKNLTSLCIRDLMSGFSDPFKRGDILDSELKDNKNNVRRSTPVNCQLMIDTIDKDLRQHIWFYQAMFSMQSTLPETCLDNLLILVQKGPSNIKTEQNFKTIILDIYKMFIAFVFDSTICAIPTTVVPLINYA
nr:unnamed protein product [Callosobruchus analis]